MLCNNSNNSYSTYYLSSMHMNIGVGMRVNMLVRVCSISLVLCVSV